MDAIAFIAERKIEEAIHDGEFETLPGAGKPLQLEDTSHMPADMRMAYTILKNSGYLEEPLQEAHPTAMRDLMHSAPEEGRIYGKMQRLKLMMARVRRAQYPLHSAKAVDLEESPYLEKLVDRV